MSYLGNDSIQMEGVMKFLILLLFFINHLFAQDVPQVVGTKYYQYLLGQIHESPLINSPQVTTIQCNHPVKIMMSDQIKLDQNWFYVEVSDFKGFMRKELLSDHKTDCLQARYPKFWDAMNLDLVQLYYWGKLYDQYIIGEIQVP